MLNPPPAIVFINGEIQYPSDQTPFIGSIPANITSYASVSELTNLQIQLFIDDTMSKEEFDARVKSDPNYPTIVHLQHLRILVILPKHVPFCEIDNLELADVVLFLHQGLADIERCHFGPPRQNFETQRLTIYEILRAAHPHGHFRDHDDHDRGNFRGHERDHDHDHDHDHERPRSHVVTLPSWYGVGEGCEGGNCGSCNYPFYCDRCHTFSGIRKCRKCDCECKCGCDCGIDNQGIRQSPIHAPNCDNEYHNLPFIRRK
jgi:hypothetical protein